MRLREGLAWPSEMDEGSTKVGVRAVATGTGSEGMAAGIDQAISSLHCAQIFLGLSADE